MDAFVEGSGYPFPEISGCAAVYKLISALRFSYSSWYKADCALLTVTEEDDKAVVDCIKVRNLVPVSKLSEDFNSVDKSISDTKLPYYLNGQLILVWNKKQVQKKLTSIFGNRIQFNMIDIREEVAKLYPSMAGTELAQLKLKSKIARYGDHAPTEIGGFYNIFVTYVQQQLKKEHPQFTSDEEKDLQLVTLAAIADIMPMQNENRLFVKKGLESINSGNIRKGLAELMSELNMFGKKLTTTDLSWDIVPNLNAAGRLGHAEIAVELFLSKDPIKREESAKKIVAYNTERKKLTQEAMEYSREQSTASITDHSGKLCLVIDERINKGVCGILAGRIVSTYDVPAIVMTFIDDTAIGSMRSCRNFDVTPFLEDLSDLFISHGGHDFAAGFSLEKCRLEEFKTRLREKAKSIVLSEGAADTIEVDAEIPAGYMTKELININDRFEPFGHQNPQLVFMSRNLPVISGMIMGKTEKQHLKIQVDSGKAKWPCLFWNEGNRWQRDFSTGDKVDILYKIERNNFNGMETLQLNLSGIEKTN